MPAHIKLTGTLLGCAALTALTACSGASSSSTAAASDNVATAPAGASSATAAASSGSSPTGSSPTGAGATTVSRCVAADLSGKLAFTPGSGSPSPSATATLVLTNKSSSPCSLDGYASFGFLNGAGALVAASHTTYDHGTPVKDFTVAPGGAAYALVTWKLCGTGGAQGNGGNWTSGVVFTAPGDTAQLNLAQDHYEQAYGRVCSFNFTATALTDSEGALRPS
ncbi:MAG: DUF4232 domain-containing protein [Trebonia sp.]